MLVKEVRIYEDGEIATLQKAEGGWLLTIEVENRIVLAEKGLVKEKLEDILERHFKANYFIIKRKGENGSIRLDTFDKYIVWGTDDYRIDDIFEVHKVYPNNVLPSGTVYVETKEYRAISSLVDGVSKGKSIVYLIETESNTNMYRRIENL